MTDIKDIQAGVKEQSEKVLSELQTLRDEIKLKLHLASAEGKDAWNKLEPQLLQLEQRIGGATDAAKTELVSAGHELKAGFDRLYQSLTK